MKRSANIFSLIMFRLLKMTTIKLLNAKKCIFNYHYYYCFNLETNSNLNKTNVNKNKTNINENQTECKQMIDKKVNK